MTKKRTYKRPGMPEVEIIAPGLDAETLEALTDLTYTLLEHGHDPHRFFKRVSVFLEDTILSGGKFDAAACVRYATQNPFNDLKSHE